MIRVDRRVVMALAVPFLVVGLGARALVPRWGDAMARTLFDLTAAPKPAAVPEIAPSPPSASDDDAGAVAEAVDASPASADAGLARRVASAKGADAGRGLASDDDPPSDGGRLAIFVPAAMLEKTLAEQGSHLKGRTARDADGKAIGVRLMGISAAKTPLHDGDLIVAIEGRPTPDDDVATDAALAAVAKGKNPLHVTLLRGSRPIDLTLELPADPSSVMP